jgi:23S rRNA (cytosine1962-C5)-methyltransferase
MVDWTQLPKASEKRIAIHITPQAERAVKQGHPWLFDQAIRKQSHEGQTGDLAVVFDKKRRFLAIGLYDAQSPIRVRILQHHQPQSIDAQWFQDRVTRASQKRAHLLETATTGYRVIYGESDGLPALILDRYASVYVLKLYSSAWLLHLHDVVQSIQNVLDVQTLVLRMSRNMAPQAQRYGLYDGQVLVGNTLTQTQIAFEEYGLHFMADVVHGHKTGYFFDQRENRQRIRNEAKGKTVLDVFAYSGGFSVYAAAGGATHVTSIDISEPALQQAQDNMQRNNHLKSIDICEHEVIAEDAFVALERLHRAGRQFDIVIVDPPAFAKRQSEVSRAYDAYRRLAELALPLLHKNGLWVSASCSSRVTAYDFKRIMDTALHQASRTARQQDMTSHAVDHPIGFPEAEYLKCLWTYL